MCPFLLISFKSSVVIHPHHKLQYFKNAGWKEDWIETSQAIVHAEFDQTYAFMDIDDEALDSEAPCPTVHIFWFILLLDADFFFSIPHPLLKNIFDELPALSAPLKTDHDKLDHYLSTDPEHVTDAVAWWYKKQFVYPCLHCMALDYLTIPGDLFFCWYLIKFIGTIISISYICWRQVCI